MTARVDLVHGREDEVAAGQSEPGSVREGGREAALVGGLRAYPLPDPFDAELGKACDLAHERAQKPECGAVARGGPREVEEVDARVTRRGQAVEGRAGEGHHVAGCRVACEPPGRGVDSLEIVIGDGVDERGACGGGSREGAGCHRISRLRRAFIRGGHADHLLACRFPTLGRHEAEEGAPREQFQRRVQDERVRRVLLRERDDTGRELEHLLVGELAVPAGHALVVDSGGVEVEVGEGRRGEVHAMNPRTST